MKYKIAISGSYGGMNLGDEAILEGIRLVCVKREGLKGEYQLVVDDVLNACKFPDAIARSTYPQGAHFGGY